MSIVLDLEGMYDQMLSDAESLLGKRVRSFGVGRFRFNDTAGARPRLMIESNNAIIELNKVARNNDVWAVCSLAHEMVHVLNPKTGGATVLEEGLACHFALLECDKYMPGNRKDAESWSTNEYKLALDAVAPIVIDIRKVKIMRVRGL